MIFKLFDNCLLWERDKVCEKKLFEKERVTNNCLL